MSSTASPKAIFLCGATATGKTGLAIDLVKHFPVDIISVDSAMVYRGMDIGSAKPEAEVLLQAPHALVDIRDPEDSYSAADFSRDAHASMKSSWAAGRIPLLVGGTMLYFNSLEQGLSQMPAADHQLRASIDKRATAEGWPALHAQLQGLDPVAAARIKCNDRQRIQRALEICLISGESMTSLQAKESKTPLSANLLKLVLTAPDRAALHQRINSRFTAMLKAGFLDEMKALMSRSGLKQTSTSMRSVGYRQAWEYLSGNLDFPGFEQQVVAATRQLAKRQLTWLRQMPASLWYDWPRERNSSRIIKRVGEFLEIQD